MHVVLHLNWITTLKVIEDVQFSQVTELTVTTAILSKQMHVVLHLNWITTLKVIEDVQFSQVTELTVTTAILSKQMHVVLHLNSRLICGKT